MTPEEFQKFYPRVLGWIDVSAEGSHRKYSNLYVARVSALAAILQR